MNALALEWTPIPLSDYDRTLAGPTKKERAAAWRAHVAMWRCRDCGAKVKLNQGGAEYLLCDDCATIDGCEEWTRRHPHPDGLHRSMWATPRHTEAQHTLHLAAQARRRATYLKSVTS